MTSSDIVKILTNPELAKKALALLQADETEQNQAEKTRTIEDPLPIEEWENREVKGNARASKRVYDDHIAKVTKLRERQEAYEAGLPKDPLEALADISSTLRDMSDGGEASEAVRSVLEIIRQLANFGALDDSQQMKDAVYWLAWEGMKGFDAMDASINRARDVAIQFHPRHNAYRA